MHHCLRYDSNPRVLSECLFATGRSCILHLLRRYNPDRVFVPSICPAGVLDPIDHERIAYSCYPLTADLDPDHKTLDELIGMHESKRPLVVQINYFGFWIDALTAAVAHRHGGILFEDCAHCLPDKDREMLSDVSLFTFNKNFPLVDGAAMLSCTAEVNIDQPKKELEPLEDEAANAYRQHLRANHILANLRQPRDSFEHMLVADAIEQSRARYEQYYAVISKNMEPRFPVSADELKLHDPIMERMTRLRYSRCLGDAVPRSMQVRFPNLPTMLFPIQVHDRASVKSRLADLGVLASFLSDKWHSFLPHKFWESHLLLPIKGMNPCLIENIGALLEPCA